MRLTLKGRLAFVRLTVHFAGQSAEVTDVLIDTGSDTTLLPADALAPLGILATSGTHIQQVSGIGGSEYVYSHWIDALTIGENGTERFLVQVGDLDYGFGINGILGQDFFLATRAVLDMGSLTIAFPAGGSEQSQT